MAQSDGVSLAQRHEASAEFTPYISPHQSPREFTLRALVLGSILGILFAASSVYLALKVGLTVSASIPIAVMSISIFRAFGRATILENNIVQTTGSAGESIAAGVAFTLPALLLLGQELEMVRVLLVSLFGGLLGVLMMIPLRQGLIVKEHGKLAYPEGTACAQVLIVGEQGGMNARTVFAGFGIGAVYKVLNSGIRLWQEVPERIFQFFKGGSISAEISPEMLGVGYIIGPRVAGNMMAGGVLAFLILVPLIHLFGDALTSPMFPANKLINEMSPHEVRNNYILYIGSGAVATGGIISLLRALPTIAAAFRRGLQSLSVARSGKTVEVLRTEQDLPITWVVGGSIALVVGIAVAPVLDINPVSAVLIILFGFFFVTVSSRITGEIGSSSNPISGMTVATLLITCLLFVAVGWTGISYRAMALSTAAIVCVAASNGGTISQDLKTGFLVGATPRYQQLAIMVGVLTSALVIGGTLKYLNEAYTLYVPQDYPAFSAPVLPDAPKQKGPDGASYQVVSVPEVTQGVPMGRYLADDSGHIRYLIDPGIGGAYLKGLSATGQPKEVKQKLDAPKARLFSLIVDGILSQRLPWGLVLVGVMLALMMELCGVSSLPFAVGVYLPISTSTPIFVGGLVRWYVDRKQVQSAADAESSPGVLFSSGLIAGGAIGGLFLAVLMGLEWDAWNVEKLSPATDSALFSALPFVALAAILYRIGSRASSESDRSV